MSAPAFEVLTRVRMLQSENDPANDPVILWLAGPAGYTSLSGLFFQWGPYTLNEICQPPQFRWNQNPASLNQNATVIFLDQPGDTGLSSTDSPVTNSSAAAEDVIDFLSKFRDTTFGKQTFKTQPLHLAGQDYAGHYIPFIANRISKSSPQTRDKIKLKSVLIGNPSIDDISGEVRVPGISMMREFVKIGSNVLIECLL